MKRGNTALKRGLGLASVFALAVAGAVVAAPAASAAGAGATATASIRALPIANANQIGADGNKLAAPTGFTTLYSSIASTGNVPTIQAGVNGQRVSDAQVVLVGTGSAFAWAPADALKLTLPAGVTFNGTPTVSVTPKSVTLTDLDSNVTATEPSGAVSFGATLIGTVNSTNANELDITPSTTVTANAATTDGFVVTVSGIYVNVPDTFVGSSAANYTVTAAVSKGASVPAVAGTTTLGYVTPFGVSAAGSYSANAKVTTIPDITVTELVKDALANGAYALTVTTNPAAATATPVVVSGGTVTATGTTGVTGTVSDSGAVSTVTLAGTPSTTALDTFTLSGLTATNVPADATITVTLTSPKGTASTASTFSFTPNQSALPSATISSTVAPPRTAGVNRYDTAAKVAQMGTWSGKAVVLANGLDVKQGVDALSANFLAGAKNAPVLLTDSSNTLPTETQLALTRLFSGQTGDLTIYVMGKTDSVSQAAQDSAKAIVKAAANTSANVTVKEIAGANRYATSAAVVTEATSSIRAYNLGAGTYRTAFLASGVVNADALAAGGFSAGAGIPVLLVQDGAKAVSDEVAAAIKSANIGQVIVLGGTDRVSDDVVKQLTDSLNVSKVVREQGADRYVTAANINTFAFAAAPTGLGLALTGQTAYLASGAAGWADALTVGPLAGQQKAPVLTVPVDSLPAAAQSFLVTNKANINAIDALGGTDRIADSVITAAQAAIK